MHARIKLFLVIFQDRDKLNTLGISITLASIKCCNYVKAYTGDVTIKRYWHFDAWSEFMHTIYMHIKCTMLLPFNQICIAAYTYMSSPIPQHLHTELCTAVWLAMLNVCMA